MLLFMNAIMILSYAH